MAVQWFLANTYPSFWHSFVAILAGLVAYAVFGRVYTRYWYLKDIPGPKSAAFTRLWLVRAYGSTNAVQKFVEANKTYGKLTTQT